VQESGAAAFVEAAKDQYLYDQTQAIVKAFNSSSGGLAYAGAFAIGAKSCRQPSPPAVPVGEFKSFGPLGPKYEVGRAIRQLGDGDWMIEITMIETGEKAEYRWSHLIDDPQAH